MMDRRGKPVRIREAWMCRGRVSSVLARVDFGGVWPRVLSTRARVQKQKRSKGPKKKVGELLSGDDG